MFKHFTEKKCSTPQINIYNSKDSKLNTKNDGIDTDIENMRTIIRDETVECDNKSISSSTSRKRRSKKPIFNRVWGYLKHAWVGVIRGSTGRFSLIFSENSYIFSKTYFYK